MIDISNIKNVLHDIKVKKPLVLCLTNVVTMDFVANSLLAIGAAPIMSSCEEEIDELVKISSAVYINIGTINHNFIKLAHATVAAATAYNKPMVLDPVGSGATNIRTTIAKTIAASAKIIRGNSSEIISLVDSTQATYGVEAIHTTDEAALIATRLSQENNAIVIVSGPIDFITNGKTSIQVPFGSQLMQSVTGMGCSLTAIIAAFQAITQDSLAAGNMATHYFSLCGEIVSHKHHTPGTFKIAFLDQLHTPNLDAMQNLYEQRK